MSGQASERRPTFLANTLLRVDFAQLLSRSPNSLIQVGITQYF